MSEESFKDSLRRELERMEAHDVDLALTALGEVDEASEVVALAMRLKRERPYLFKSTARAPLAMGVIPDALSPSKREIEDLAAKAREGSDRGAMLRFMRARRSG